MERQDTHRPQIYVPATSVAHWEGTELGGQRAGKEKRADTGASRRVLSTRIPLKIQDDTSKDYDAQSWEASQDTDDRKTDTARSNGEARSRPARQRTRAHFRRKFTALRMLWAKMKQPGAAPGATLSCPGGGSAEQRERQPSFPRSRARVSRTSSLSNGLLVGGSEGGPWRARGACGGD